MTTLFGAPGSTGTKPGSDAFVLDPDRAVRGHSRCTSGPTPRGLAPDMSTAAFVDRNGLREVSASATATALLERPVHPKPSPTPAPPATGKRRPETWLRKYGLLVTGIDVLVVVAAILTAYVLRFAVFPEVPAKGTGIAYLLISILIATAWVFALALGKTRDRRILGVGSTEYGRVWRASWILFACVAVVAYLLRFDLARGYVAIAFPVGGLLLLAGRCAARQFLHRKRRAGRAMTHVVVAGSEQGVTELILELNTSPVAGYAVVGACITGGRAANSRVCGVPVLGDTAQIPQVVQQTGAAAVAVVGSEQLTGGLVRDLGYELEEMGTDLIIAPALRDVAGPRVVMTPVEGMSLVHVDAPLFTGVRYVVKSMIDWALAFLALVVLALPMLVIAVLVKATSPGPVLFKQERVGRNGTRFKMLKFRSMRIGAEAELDALRELNEGSGPLFKLRDDPRVTRVGAVLRKYSLDELPQFINVLLGHMSLVGPRPPLPSEVAEYDDHAARRMLVKPGLTGLWQISGRSDLAWEVGLRKDVYYVENWTVLGDFLILLRTARTVLFPNGAY